MRLRAALMASALAMCTPAYSGIPRHVRILWSVQLPAGSRALPPCARVQPLNEEFTLSVPEPWPCADPKQDSGWVRVTDTLVQPGDYVTVYAVNYNAISYKPAAAVVTTVKPEDPQVLALLLAAVQVAGIKVPSGGMSIMTEGAARADLPSAPKSNSCETAQGPAACLDAIGGQVKAVEALAGDWLARFKTRAAAIAQARARVPAQLEREGLPPGTTDFGIPFLAQLPCEFSSLEKVDPLGEPCGERDGWLQKVGVALGTGYSLVREFDSTPWTSVSGPEMQRRDRYRAALEAWLEYFTGTRAGVRSELAIDVTRLADDLATIKAWRKVLDSAKRATYAAELPRQGPVAGLSRLVFALPLRAVGDPDTAPPKLSRTFEVEVAGRVPTTTASAGLMMMRPSALNFKTLALAQEPNGSGGLQRRLVLQDGTDYRTFTALAAVNFHLRWRALYATAATTADKQAFKSLLLGPSWYFPQWRSFMTFAMLRARGSRPVDLDPLIASYSNSSGVVPDTLTLTQIQAPAKWYRTITIGWTVTPF